jgi:CBS domain-containing protein
MKAEDVMTPDVATCRASDSLNRAAQLMWERRCGCVPVIDDDDRVVGLLTDRDVCMAAYTQGRRLDDIAATVAMSRPVRTCLPMTALEDVEDLMMAFGVRRLVVADGDGRLCGLLSLDDIAKNAAAWDGKGEIDLERVAVTLAEIARRNGSTDEETPETQSPETDIRDLVQNSLAALRTLRDEIRVDLNLAGKEARDRWRRLEARLQAAETYARDARREAVANLAGLLETTKRFRNRLRQEQPPASQAR